MKKQILQFVIPLALLVFCLIIVSPYGALAEVSAGGQTIPPQGGSSGAFQPIVGIPGVSLNESGDLPSVLNGLFRVAIAGAGVLAVLFIIVGGFEYMVSEAREGKKTGRERIQSAIIGLVLLLLSFIILSVINPDLLNLNPFRTQLTPLSSTGEQPGIYSFVNEQHRRNDRQAREVRASSPLSDLSLSDCREAILNAARTARGFDSTYTIENVDDDPVGGSYVTVWLREPGAEWDDASIKVYAPNDDVVDEMRANPTPGCEI